MSEERVTAQSMVAQSMAEFFPGMAAAVPAAPVPGGATAEPVTQTPIAGPPAGGAGPSAEPPVTPPPAPPASPQSLSSRYTEEPAPAGPPASSSEIPETPPSAEPGKPAGEREVYTWGKLRTEAKRLEQEAQAAKSALEALRHQAEEDARARASLAAEVEKFKGRESELIEKLGKLSLSESPEFQEKYGLKLSALKSKLGTALVKYAGVSEGDTEAFSAKLLSSPAAELPSLLEGLNPSVAGMILNITSEASAIEEARTQELANWKSSSAAARMTQTREAVLAQAESRRRESEQAVDFAKRLGNPVYGATDPGIQEVAQKISQEFHGFVQTATEAQLIRAAAEGFTAPYLVEIISGLQRENAELSDRLSTRLRAAQPPITPFSPATVPPPPPTLPKGVTPAESPDSPHRYMVDALSRSFAGG